MEPGYNDPNYWMRWYAGQQLQRARQGADAEPADQDGVEQQLGELQLRSAEESSPPASSPEAPAARSRENIQRTDIGGSMRMPPRSNLRDNSSSSTRYSVDVAHAYLGSGASDYQSDLRGRPFRSMRYTAPSEAQPEARARESKSRGLFSRVKSGSARPLEEVAGRSRRAATPSIQSSAWISQSAVDRPKRTWS
ncbi:hypothetical protein [Bradyrhizobium forestalis]|uniref:hypothetical protein n=1 Tax=Bradyrhizobium forestalis TaxID=1419263 RepID=UPI0011AF6961|nr:hypothetical protein [Bradyrhizobium forestalis]